MIAIAIRYWWAFVLAAAIAWGGLGWYGKAAAERDLSAYQASQAKLINDQLRQILDLQKIRDQAAATAVGYYLEGKKNAETAFQPLRTELANLRSRFPAVDPHRLPERPGDDSNALPATPEPAGGTDATACTGEPGRIVAATDRVAADLAACAQTQSQLIALQAWVKSACAP